MKIKIGKQLPQAIYIHPSYIDELPNVFKSKVYAASKIVGEVEGCNLIKISKKENKVSFMIYSNFDKDPHPPLAHSTLVDIEKESIKEMCFENRNNPPILHRKETFVGEDYPFYNKFRKLTIQEEKAGLLSRNNIGTKNQWRDFLNDKGYEIKGHKVNKTEK